MYCTQEHPPLQSLGGALPTPCVKVLILKGMYACYSLLQFYFISLTSVSLFALLGSSISFHQSNTKLLFITISNTDNTQLYLCFCHIHSNRMCPWFNHNCQITLYHPEKQTLCKFCSLHEPPFLCSCNRWVLSWWLPVGKNKSERRSQLKR